MGNQQWNMQVEFRFDYATYDLKIVIATAEQINELLDRFNHARNKRSSAQENEFLPTTAFQTI